jgi:CRP-like cAMP-binding protein
LEGAVINPSRDTDDHKGNRILAGLSEQHLEHLRPHLRRVNLEVRRSIWEPNQPIHTVYFPLTCVTSVIALDEAGGAVEVGTIGNEGMVGLPVFLGARSATGRAFTQIAGEAWELSTEQFLPASQNGQLREVLQRYTQGFVTQVSQSVACNRLHVPKQRLARWLLSCRDRVGVDQFPLTQEFMSQMLGVRRATVSEAASALQEDGLIRYSRGILTITDRPGLEAAACDCYRIVRDEFDRLLGKPAG